ncbi:hypothetical protein Q9K02_10725 [Qipengyuania sp. G39]|uniref:Uncharacterized protein n=1 Tax=Qipengyuania profundimaris TaxID=3067652 RepID=A0ABT9HR49_9SPHN|nr:hypothetical protein [Qipengyuania sp. G39]MDP4575611.1 hypothetical protein [Qipengyuania sp. G39]
MMRTFLLTIASFALASPASAQDETYPADEVFEAFRDGCGPIENQASTAARLEARGWRKVDAEDQAGELADFIAFSNELALGAVAAEDATMSPLQAFEKTVADEKVFIILDEYVLDGSRVSGCQLYDFGESRSIPPSFGERQLGREPDNLLDRPEIQRSEWTPGLNPEHDSFRIFYVPADSPAAEMLRFTGVVLMSDTLGAN